MQKSVAFPVTISSKKSNVTTMRLNDTYRYSGTRADRTRLPMTASEDGDNDEGNFFEANVKLERSECLRKESNVRFNYYNIADKVPLTTLICNSIIPLIMINNHFQNYLK